MFNHDALLGVKWIWKRLCCICQLFKCQGKGMACVAGVAETGTLSPEMVKQVDEVIQDSESEQTWMGTPMPKVKFYNWFQEATG